MNEGFSPEQDVYVNNTDASFDREREGGVEEAGMQAFSTERLESFTRKFLGEDVKSLSQEEVDEKISQLLVELAKREVDGFGLFAFALPETTSAEEIKNGDSAAAKVYRALFNFSRTEEYKSSPDVQRITRELEGVIDQNPQMMGPVAMWQVAKDVMWRKDVPAHAKGSLMGSMTYALSFFDVEQYEEELLKQLDFEETNKYAESAHMLEALKQFWSHGHESYAEDRGVPDFYTKALENIKETPDSNYLLSMRAREILSMLQNSEDFPAEAVDSMPFELSKGIYASTQNTDGLTVSKVEQREEIRVLIDDFWDNEAQIVPPQWMIDEAIERRESYVSWEPSQDLIQNRQQIFDEVHMNSALPVEHEIGDLSYLEDKEREELLFDYEYLVSKSMREMIQREFDFELKDLTIKEQIFFLNYLKKVTVAESGDMKGFTATYGAEGMRTFLALERGDESLGDQIVAFGENGEEAEKVFSYYGELLDSAEEAEQLVRKVSACAGDACGELAEQVRENILNRAQKDLERAVQLSDVSEIAELIGNYAVEAKEYVALLQEVDAGKIEFFSAAELAVADKEQMSKLLKDNFERICPGPEDANFRDAVSASFSESLDNPSTDFNILRDGEKIVSFNRFDAIQSADGSEVSYFGSFNVDPAYSGVGEVMLDKTLDTRLESSGSIMAHADPTQPITKKYINEGFVVTDIISNYAGSRREIFEIWRTSDIADHLKSKTLSTAELLENTNSYEGLVVRELTESDKYIEITQGKALTRYFTHDKRTYVVFEELPADLKLKFNLEREEEKEAA